MRWQPFGSNTIAFAAVTVIFGMSAGCERQQVVSAPIPEIPPPTAMRATHGPVVAQPLPTRLQRPASEYNAEQFRQLLDAAQWSNGERHREAGGVDVQIDAVAGVRNFYPNAEYAGEHGTVIARVINRGTSADTTFRAEPGDTVYAIVGPGWTATDHVALVQIFRLRGGTFARLRDGQYRACPYHAPHDEATPAARFGRCETREAVQSAAPMRGPAAPDVVAALSRHNGGQIDCPMGCCEFP